MKVPRPDKRYAIYLALCRKYAIKPKRADSTMVWPDEIKKLKRSRGK